MKMKKFVNRSLAITLCIVMVLSLMPMTAFAVEGNIASINGDVTGHSFGEDGKCTDCGVIGGYCGADGYEQSVVWTYNETTGALAIIGTGAMKDFNYNGGPWYSYRSDIKALTISEGVSNIGAYAFYNCVNLNSVTVPASVTTIGLRAFHSCGGLTSITFADGSKLTKIYASAFTSSGLTSITIPAEVTVIGATAFSGCRGLTSVIFADGSKLETIYDNAFLMCSNLTGITIPTSVTSIGTDAFSYCTSLTTVNVGCNWKETPLYAFGGEVTVNIPEHNLTYTPNEDDTTHKKSCNTCGYDVTENHDHTNGKCVCGMKATPTVIAPTANVFTYNGEAQDLISAGMTTGGMMEYKLDNGEWTAEVPVAKNAGTYTVYYRIVGDENYEDVAQQSLTVNIKKVALTIKANDHRIRYGEAPANDGVICSGFVGSDTMGDLIGTLSFAYTYSEGDNVGDYEITPSGLTAKNYDITFKSGTLTVDKATATYTAPTANDLTYNGQMHELVTAGTVNGGKMVFSFDKEGGYSETLEARNAGNYTVWYKVIGDANHNDSVPASIPVEIRKATPDLGTVSADGVVNDTTKPEDVILTQTGTVSGTFKLTDSAMLADKTVYNYTFTPNDSTNYNSVNGQVTIDVQDTVAPKAIISVDEHKWTFWDAITLGLFYNESKEVAITYADNENGSGIKETLYYVADKEMTVEELQTVQWTVYNEAFEIDPDGEYVIYAKVVDNDGNMLVINSDGLVLDKTQAVVEGLTNGGAYYGSVTFTVTDALAGIKDVTIDNAPATATEGRYTIAADNAEHTVVVTDNAGNVTEYKVMVYKNYTVTYKVDGEVISTQTVGHGKDATAPAILEKVGYVGKWDRNNENITADTEINTVYTKLTDVVPDNLKPEDKTELEDAKKQLEEMLNDDSYTEDDKKDIQDAIDSIDDALKVVENVEGAEGKINALPENITKDDTDDVDAAKKAYDELSDYEKTLVDPEAKKKLDDAIRAAEEANKPADTNSPQTGDNSNLWLWWLLLIVSAAGVTILCNEQKKRRAMK